MSDRIFPLLSTIHSPTRLLGLVLMIIFTTEFGVMLLLPFLIPSMLGETGRAVFDAILLTTVCAPILWWVIIGPLRRIAIQEHERSETIVANASEGIVTFDPDGVIRSGNRALAKLLLIEMHQLVGTAIQSFLGPWPKTLDDLPTSFRMVAQRSDGTQFPVEVSISEFPSETSALQIAIIRDLTDAERSEAERVMMARETEALRAQQMATLAQLATGVAHEIRNPLTSIKMLIQINREKFSASGLRTDDLELVEQEIRRMERSVNSLLEYARPEITELTSFPIQQVIQKAVQLIKGRCHQQSVVLEVEYPPSPLVVVGDAAQLQQLLLNLSLNALDSMPDGGQLKIQSTNSISELELSVIDSGHGIRADMMKTLFDPFSTSKVTGVGLGLGICRRIASAHGGSIEGHNRSEGGAEFRLTMPLPDTTRLAAEGIGGQEDSCKPF